MRSAMLSAAFVLGLCALTSAGTRDELFEDPLFRRCIGWMLDGEGGALIDSRCRDLYDIPPPSLFLCARKVLTGFTSPTDREACAIIYEEQVEKVRAGYISGPTISEY